MPYKTGIWGEQEKSRSKKRLEYFRKIKREWHAKTRILILEKLGGKCVRCGFSDYRALQIDHINGEGAKERRKFNHSSYWNKVKNDEEGLYQILCANCNWIKRHENEEYGGMPREVN